MIEDFVRTKKPWLKKFDSLQSSKRTKEKVVVYFLCLVCILHHPHRKQLKQLARSLLYST